MTIGRRVYVNGLAPETSWQGLKDHFKAVAPVVHADVLTVLHTAASLDSLLCLHSCCSAALSGHPGRQAQDGNIDKEMRVVRNCSVWGTCNQMLLWRKHDVPQGNLPSLPGMLLRDSHQLS